jgi:hypothetical protein
MPRAIGIGIGVNFGGRVPFSPLDLSPALWLDAADTSTITESSGSVSQWTNKGSLGNVTQGTGANQPTTGSATQNGLNVLTFDGGDRLAGGTVANWKFLHDGTKWICAAAVRAGTGSNPNAAYALFATNGGYGQIGDTGVAFWFDDRTGASRNNAIVLFASNNSASYQHDNSQIDVWNPNAFTVVSAFADLGNATAANRSEVFINNGSAIKNNVSTGAVSASNPTQAIGIGGTSSASFRWVGQIGELVIVSGANATETNRQLLRDYLTAKWGV